MPTRLPHATPLQSGEAVPSEWLAVDGQGMAGRFNAGVCLLEPSLALLTYIVGQMEPTRDLRPAHGGGGAGGVEDVFGAAWRPSWTPEEDALTRAT
eukprot:15461750-Alexandrium_andersonii.AAC.1